jgi:hypothetical protein
MRTVVAKKEVTDISPKNWDRAYLIQGMLDLALEQARLERCFI